MTGMCQSVYHPSEFDEEVQYWLNKLEEDDEKKAR
jgi:hypothetical protein